MKKFIICLIFLISFANAIQCYNGKTYVDIPESKLSEVGYTEYNITHSSFDCKIAYKRYLKVKETEQVNVSYITKNEKSEIKEPSKIGFLLICLLVIVGVIWLIKNVIKDEPQNEWNLPVQQEQVKPKNNSIKTEYQIKSKNNIKSEPVKSWDDLSREYSENLRKIEEEKVKNGFYVIPKSEYINNSLNKTKTAYDLLLERPEWKKGDVPYYPVNNEKNNALYQKYKDIKNDKVEFVGRLGQYKYYDMDDTIEAALKLL